MLNDFLYVFFIYLTKFIFIVFSEKNLNQLNFYLKQEKSLQWASYSTIKLKHKQKLSDYFFYFPSDILQNHKSFVLNIPFHLQ